MRSLTIKTQRIMNTFPITNKDYNSKFNTFYSTAMLPVFDWGQKLYMEYDGALRAVIPLYAAHVSNVKKTGMPSQDGSKDLVCFDIAGVGRKLLKWEVYYDDQRVRASNWNTRIFRTTDDYDRYIKGEKGTEYVPGGMFVKDIFKNHGYNKFERSCWEDKIICWCWNYDEPRECPVSFKDLWIDEDGPHVTVIMEGWGDSKYPAYLTREECLAANRKVVVDFDDAPALPKDQIWVVNLPKTVSVKAETAEEAERIVNDAVKSLVGR